MFESFVSLLPLAQAAPDFAAIVNQITTGLQPVFVPIAVLGLTVFLLLLAGAPIFGDATAQYKGYVMRVCLIVTVVGLLPTMLQWLSGLGGGGTTTDGEATPQSIPWVLLSYLLLRQAIPALRAPTTITVEAASTDA
jgi:hypothetical protein